MKVIQERDILPGRRLLAVTAFVVAAIAAGSTVAWLIAGCRQQALGGQPYTGSAQLDPRQEVDAIEMNLFEARGESPPPPAAPPQLDTYGWVDRDAGVVHIPVERAVELYLEQHRDTETER